MSMATFAMPIVLDGPLPAPPPHALLSLPGVLVEEAGDRWQSGATIYSYPPGVPDEWDPCSTGTTRLKSDGDVVPLPVFASFVAYLPITCTASSIGDPDEFRGRAEKVMHATESYAVEHALSQGVTGLANPYFDDAAVDILAGGAAVKPEVGLAYLEDAIGATGRLGLIHATPAVASRWFQHPLMGDLKRTTSLGTPVAAGGGYAGAKPSGGAAATAGKAWAFATGPVEVRHSDVDILELRDVLDRSDNTVTFRAEMSILATWDTELQAAVLIDWTL